MTITKDSRFRSLVEFEEKIQKYCIKNAINGEKLRYCRKNERLQSKHSVEANIIETFYYKYMRLTCCEHKFNKKNKSQPSCTSHIYIRYDQKENVFCVNSFNGEHTNHLNQTDQKNHENQKEIEVMPKTKLQQIHDLIEQLPEIALESVLDACRLLVDHWNDQSNKSVRIEITPFPYLWNDPNDPNYPQELVSGAYLK